MLMGESVLLHSVKEGSPTMGAKFLLSSAVVVALALPAFCQDTATFRGNSRHTGVYQTVGVATFHKVKWKFPTGGQVISSPAVTGETVFVGSTDGNLYAIDRESGSEKWKFDAKSRVVSSPALANGIVYFTAYDGNLYAVDSSSGQLKWKFQTGGERRFAAKHLHGAQPAAETMPDPWDCYLSSPVVWNGGVYFGSGDTHIYALDAATGALKWKFKTGDVVHASPAIADGTLFVGSWDSYFYALDAASGKEKWRFKSGDDPDTHNQVGIQSSAAVVDGTVYFGCRDANLYALDAATGQKKWVFPNNHSWVLNSPAVKDGKVYFATSDSGLFYELDAKSGRINFQLKFQGWPTFSSPGIAGEMLYVGSTSGKLIAVDLAKREIAWTFETEGAKQNGRAFTKPDGTSDYFSAFPSNFYDDIMFGYGKLLAVGTILSSPVVLDGVVYVGSADGNLYALM
jgi:outer membrane protein assembly factor BamB